MPVSSFRIFTAKKQI